MKNLVSMAVVAVMMFSVAGIAADKPARKGGGKDAAPGATPSKGAAKKPDTAPDKAAKDAGAPAAAAKVDLATVAQTPRVTLNVKDRPVDEVIAEIAKQSGRRVAWDDFRKDKKNVTVSLKGAFFWDALLTVCKQGGWGFQIFSQPGKPFEVGGAGQPPVRAYQVAGPVALIWFGLAEETTFNFDVSPPQPVKVTWYMLDLKMDPGCGLSVRDPVMNPDIKFVIDGGKPITIKPDKESQDGMGGRAWRFKQGGELKGKKADLEVTIPISAPGRTREAKLPWRKGATAKVGDVNVTLTEAGQNNVRFNLAYDKAVIEKIASEEQALALVLDIAGVAAVGKDKKRIEGDKGSGGGSPFGGYDYSSRFELRGGFTPAEFVVTWNEGYEKLDVPFKLKDIPLTAE